MLKEMVKKYREEKYDLNCAESIMYAANEEYDLNLSKETLKVMSGFGGGIGIGDICGVITGAVAVLGVIFTEISGHKSPRVKEMTQEFISKFQDKLTYIKCDDLKKEYTDVKRCTLMIEAGAEILEEIILKEKQNKIL